MARETIRILRPVGKVETTSLQPAPRSKDMVNISLGFLDNRKPNAKVLLGAVATGLAILGKQRLSEVGTPLPEQAIDTTKEDVRWAKTQLQSGRR